MSLEFHNYFLIRHFDIPVDMRIFSFNLILAMDFLNKIAEFMTAGLADSSPTSNKEDLKPLKSSDNMAVCIFRHAIPFDVSIVSSKICSSDENK